MAPESNRKMAPKEGLKTATAETNEVVYANEECLSKKICKGKHKKMVMNETFQKSSENLFKGLEIKIVNTRDECREAMNELRRHLDEYNVLGFDCEWISQYRRYPVALLQLSTHRGLCALIRLCKLRKIPDELKQILADKSVLKVGIQPFVDAKNLSKDYGIDSVASILDLRLLAKECGFKSGGLSGLAEEHLQIQLDKNRCICASDWEANKLLDLQIEYAAKDAHVSLELFKVFEEKLKPKVGDCDQKQHVQEFIAEYCVKYLNLERDPNSKPVERIDHFANQEIRFVNTVDECLTAIKVLKSHCDEYNVLGFKLLQTFNGPSPVHLLQLASHRRLSVIVHLNNNFRTIPKELQEMLEDKRILKVGIRPAKNILNMCSVTSTLDLTYLLCKYSKKRLSLPLPKLCKWFLKVKLPKDGLRKLQNVQKHLDKNDAHILIELFKEFVKKLEPKGDDDDDQEYNLEQFIEKHCRNYLDAKFEMNSVILTNKPSEK